MSYRRRGSSRRKKEEEEEEERGGSGGGVVEEKTFHLSSSKLKVAKTFEDMGLKENLLRGKLEREHQRRSPTEITPLLHERSSRTHPLTHSLTHSGIYACGFEKPSRYSDA